MCLVKVKCGGKLVWVGLRNFLGKYKPEPKTPQTRRLQSRADDSVNNFLKKIKRQREYLMDCVQFLSDYKLQARDKDCVNVNRVDVTSFLRPEWPAGASYRGVDLGQWEGWTAESDQSEGGSTSLSPRRCKDIDIDCGQANWK